MASVLISSAGFYCCCPIPFCLSAFSFSTPTSPQHPAWSLSFLIRTCFLCGPLYLSVGEGGGNFPRPSGLVQALPSGFLWSGLSDLSLLTALWLLQPHLFTRRSPHMLSASTLLLLLPEQPFFSAWLSKSYACWNSQFKFQLQATLLLLSEPKILCPFEMDILPCPLPL